MSEYYYSEYEELIGRLDRALPKKIWLASDYRVKIIKDGLKKAGSLNKLARVMGYTARIHPGWTVRQILIGNQPFPVDRLKKLLEFLDIPFDEAIKYRVDRRLITIITTTTALKEHGMLCYLLR